MLRNNPKALLVAFGLLLTAASCSGSAGEPDDGSIDGHAVVERAVDAVGGEALLRSIAYLRLEGIRNQRAIALAADPDLPSEVVERFSEIRDVRNGLAVRDVEMQFVQRSEPIRFTRTVAASASAGVADRLARSPERILLEAADAGDLRWVDTVLVAGETHDVVRFGEPAVELLVSRVTGLPRGWRSVRTYPDDIFVWAPWGDVETDVRWDAWALGSTGLRYPRRHATWRNETLHSTESLIGVEIVTSVHPDSVPTPEDVRAQPPAGPGEGIREVVPGVVFVPGPFNVMLVRQDEGVVVLEAPHSAEYSRLVLAEVARRFPDVPVTGVVVGSGAWPHVAGVREYVARGIPIYTAPRNAGLLERLAAVPHTLAPDSLHRAPRPPDIRVIAERTRIGTGDNAIELVPGAGPSTPRSTAALLSFIPGSRVLFAADVFVPRRFEPTFWRQVIYELTEIVGREEVEPELVSAIHLEPTGWSAFIEEARRSQAPPARD